MAEKKIGLGPVKRFGTRYGRTTKFKRAAIEVMQKNSTKCPYCNKHKVIRKSKGIWYCTKCKNKFAGQAYTFVAKPSMESLPPIAEVLAETQKKPDEETQEA